MSELNGSLMGSINGCTEYLAQRFQVFVECFGDPLILGTSFGAIRRLQYGVINHSQNSLHWYRYACGISDSARVRPVLLLASN
jgi:hypothetical protein